MRGVLFLVAFVAGAAITWLLTVHRVSREGSPDTPDTPDAAVAASDFGGSRSEESSGLAGARWMGDAEDEDALLPDAHSPRARPGTPPPA